MPQYLHLSQPTFEYTLCYAHVGIVLYSSNSHLGSIDPYGWHAWIPIMPNVIVCDLQTVLVYSIVLSFIFWALRSFDFKHEFLLRVAEFVLQAATILCGFCFSLVTDENGDLDSGFQGAKMITFSILNIIYLVAATFALCRAGIVVQQAGRVSTNTDPHLLGPIRQYWEYLVVLWSSFVYLQTIQTFVTYQVLTDPTYHVPAAPSSAQDIILNTSFGVDCFQMAAVLYIRQKFVVAPVVYERRHSLRNRKDRGMRTEHRTVPRVLSGAGIRYAEAMMHQTEDEEDDEAVRLGLFLNVTHFASFCDISAQDKSRVQTFHYCRTFLGTHVSWSTEEEEGTKSENKQSNEELSKKLPFDRQGESRVV